MNQKEDVRQGVLQELMDKMRAMEGEKMRPKAVEVSIADMKPEPGEGTPEEENQDVLEGKTDGIRPEGMEPDGDELSPEDEAILEQLFGDKEHEG